MKTIKFILASMVLIFVPFVSLSMEQGDGIVKKTDWYDIPIELKQHIFAFVLNLTEMAETIEEDPEEEVVIAVIFLPWIRLKLLDKSTYELVTDKQLVKDWIKFFVAQGNFAVLSTIFKNGMVNELEEVVTDPIIFILVNRYKCMKLCQKGLDQYPLSGLHIPKWAKAICLDRYDELKKLIENKDNGEECDLASMLTESIRCGRLDITKLLLNIENIFQEDGDVKKSIALCIASQWGEIDLIPILIARGAIVNAQFTGSAEIQELTPLICERIMVKLRPLNFCLSKVPMLMEKAAAL